MTADPRIFVSYSSNSRGFAVVQRERIAAQGLALWQDFVNLEGGNAGGWWEQIVERLAHRATEHMVLFVSSDALLSDVVADEWRLARRNGVEVHLVMVPGQLTGEEIKRLPAGMATQHFYRLDIPEQFDRLIAVLRGPSRQHKVPMMAPRHDEYFVLRPEESEKLIAALLKDPNAEGGAKSSRAVGITAALRGAGGYGKTQLARWLCQQERIVEHFYDGILWVELGENPDQTGGLQGKLEELIKIAAALDVTPNYLLGVEPRAPIKKGDEAGRIRARLAAACATMDEAPLPLALTLVEAVLEHGGRGG
jgi:hypothetical protein